jgi:transcriptional regulator with XRE-family HTH domain
MANWFAEMEARQSEARVAFGRMLRLWRERNGWTQYTVADWGKQAGFPAISYGNLSAIEQGKAGELRRPAFFQLAEANQRLFSGELGAITDKGLREKIQAGQPILGADGQPWGPQELWSCYVGLLEVPEAYRQPQRGDAPRLSAAKGRELSRRWREQVGEAIEARQLDPLQALQAIARLGATGPAQAAAHGAQLLRGLQPRRAAAAVGWGLAAPAVDRQLAGRPGGRQGRRDQAGAAA